jgi:hypothetical protein
LRDVIFCSRSSRRRFWWMSNSNFVKWDFVITRFVLATNSTNSFARMKSLHCVRSILRMREIHSRKLSITFWQFCDSIRRRFDSDRKRSFESSFINWSCNIRTSSNDFFLFETANFFNWFMHLCELIDHMSLFSNANRMMISLNVCSRIWFKSSQNRFSEYCRWNFATACLMTLSWCFLYEWKILTFNNCMQWMRWKIKKKDVYDDHLQNEQIQMCNDYRVDSSVTIFILTMNLNSYDQWNASINQ